MHRSVVLLRQIHTHMYTQTHTYIQHTHIQKHTHIHRHTYNTHTHTHTHTEEASSERRLHTHTHTHTIAYTNAHTTAVMRHIDYFHYSRIQFSSAASLAGGAGKLMMTSSASVECARIELLRRTAVCMRISFPSALQRGNTCSCDAGEKPQPSGKGGAPAPSCPVGDRLYVPHRRQRE